VRLEGFGKLKKKKKYIDLIGNRTRHLPACDIALHSLRYRMPIIIIIIMHYICWGCFRRRSWECMHVRCVSLHNAS
jgi:hypothetical protein